MARLMKDELFEAQLLRAIGYAPYGGADAGECLAAAGRITGTDLDSWHDVWSGRRRACPARPRPVRPPATPSAPGSGFFRAANYFRTAGLFAMGVPLDPRLTEAHRQEVDELPPWRGAAGRAAGDRADPVRGLLPAGLLLPRRS